MDFNVFKLDAITTEVIEFYKSNLDIAKKQYEELINSAKPRGLDKTVLEGYYEVHHIKARCMGGEDIEDNLVLLNYKEHIIAHLLLFTINPEVVGLRFAFFMLANLKDVRDMDSDLYIDLISLEYIRYEAYNSPEYKEKQSELAKNIWKDPEYRKKQSEVQKDPKYKEKKSEISKNTWRDPEYREKQSEIRKDPEFRKKQSEIIKNTWSDPEYREKQSEVRKDPEYREKMSEIIKNTWKDPEFRKKHLYNKQCRGCISPDNIEYKSISEASRFHNIPRRTLSYWVSKGKYGWKRVKKS